jgi:hypothetical protein
LNGRPDLKVKKPLRRELLLQWPKKASALEICRLVLDNFDRFHYRYFPSGRFADLTEEFDTLFFRSEALRE